MASSAVFNSDSSTSGKRLLQEVLPRSLQIKYNKSPYIFFSIGHRGYSWSIVANIDGQLSFISGEVNCSGEKIVRSQVFDNKSDSLNFIASNKDLLWGVFNTISHCSDETIVHKPKTYNPIHSNISIFNSNGNMTFNYEGAIHSNDSLNDCPFKEVARIRLLMLWLAMPDIRQYLSTKDIFKQLE